MNYTLKWLIEKFDKTREIDFLFFWGHTNEGNEATGKFVFSQWYPSPFVADKVIYKTAEHWMMAAKARLFNDNESLEKILQCDTPKAAKALGRKVKGFDPVTWETNCYGIVIEGNKLKFSQNNGFKNYLLATGDKVIVEASPVDTIWGIGLTEDSKQANNPHSWRGRNLLGFALMEVRDILRN